MAFLADSSAWKNVHRKRIPAEVRQRFDALLLDNDIMTCDMVKLELLHSVNNHREFAARRTELDGMDQCPIGPEQWTRALDVFEALARRGGSLHRSVSHPDLLIAAAAEAAGAELLHYDEDFDRIASITGQPASWVAPRGSL